MINRRHFLAGVVGLPALSYLDLTAAFADTPKDVLVIAQQLDNITSLDPHEGFESISSEIITNMYQRLVVPNPANPNEVIGDLAESWKASEDGKTVTFKLKKNVTFTSGSPVTAEDAAYSLQRAVIINKTPAFIISQFGYTKDNVRDAIKAIDANTLTMTILEPASPQFLLYCLSANVGSIIEKKAAIAHEKDDDFGNNWLRNNSAGSGFFALRAWKPSESVMLDVNPNGGTNGKIKRILMRHIADPSAQLLLLQKGDVDIARNLTTEQQRGLLKDPEYTLVRTGVASLNLLSLNQKHTNLQKPQVWEAIKWAIDYQGIQKNIVPLTHSVHQSFLPKGFPGAVTDTPYKRDVGKAKALLKEAGLESGFEITLDHASTLPERDIVQAIQANLADIGIKVRLLSAEGRAVLTKMRARQHEMAFSVWGSDYFDPHSNAEAFCINSDNGDDSKRRTLAWRSAFADTDITRRATEAVREIDPQKRLALYDKLQRDFMAKSPFVIMLQWTYSAACRKGVNGVHIGILNDGTYDKITKA